MGFKIKIMPYTLQFKRPAGTSRGVYKEHKVWYVIVYDTINDNRWGIGECAPLPDLSCDYTTDYEKVLQNICNEIEEKQWFDKEALLPYPSILFGLETAFLHYETGKFNYWETPFSEGKAGIPINGLIWMGSFDYMSEQIEEKIEQGFRCIKLKIGAINFADEIRLLKHIRNTYSSQDITLRVDANGAFPPGEAVEKLKILSELEIHSIEQPIKAGQWKKMSELCSNTPLPIGLDEELIGINTIEDKKKLLETIHPQYLILKPSLHGGIRGCTEWIELAEQKSIGWWITSALESNIGLNAIAQWCSTLHNNLPQGLGTGQLYTNNIEMPLEIRKDCLWYNPHGQLFSLKKLS